MRVKRFSKKIKTENIFWNAFRELRNGNPVWISPDDFFIRKNVNTNNSINPMFVQSVGDGISRLS